MISKEQKESLKRIEQKYKERNRVKSMLNGILSELEVLLTQQKVLENKIAIKKEELREFLKTNNLNKADSEGVEVTFRKKTKKEVDYEKLEKEYSQVYFYGLKNVFDEETAILEISNNLGIPTKDAKRTVEVALQSVTEIIEEQPTMVVKLKERGE